MNVLMPVADGSEEMEIVIVVDIFRRAKWNVVIAGLGAGAIRASRGVQLVPDAAWADVTPEAFDMLVIPGGSEGVKAMTKDKRLLATARTFMANGKWVAAICARCTREISTWTWSSPRRRGTSISACARSCGTAHFSGTG